MALRFWGKTRDAYRAAITRGEFKVRIELLGVAGELGVIGDWWGMIGWQGSEGMNGGWELIS